MKLNRFIQPIWLVITALSVLGACSAVDKPSTKVTQPNVLLIMVDDLRTAVGAMGDPRAITPNIDKLASEGVMFTRAYANIPVCGASRASMMTSVYGHETRFVDYLANAEREVPSAITLGQHFKQNGYITISNGKVFHSRKDSNESSWSQPAWEPKVKGATWYSDASKKYVKPTKRGPWVESADVPELQYYDAQVKQKAVDDLSRLAAEGKPFFLAAGFRRPHLPFNAPKAYFDLYQDIDFTPSSLRGRPHGAPEMLKGSGEIHVYHFKDIDYNSDAFHTESLRGYYAAVSFIDKQVGDLMVALDTSGQRDNTIVVLTSDHGFNLGEHNFWGKHNMLNTALNIPLIVSAPGISVGRQTDALVSLVDVFPTLSEMSHLPVSSDLHQQWVGRSFLPVLKQLQQSHQPYVYSRFKQGDTLISDQLIYTEYHDESGQQTAMLFDLVNDPNETQNVVNQPRYSEAVKAMSAELAVIKSQSHAYLPTH